MSFIRKTVLLNQFKIDRIFCPNPSEPLCSFLTQSTPPHMTQIHHSYTNLVANPPSYPFPPAHN